MNPPKKISRKRVNPPKIAMGGILDNATYTAAELKKLGFGDTALMAARISEVVRPLKKVSPYRYRGAQINEWLEKDDDKDGGSSGQES